MSLSDTGHVKNVANFENLISFCTGYEFLIILHIKTKSTVHLS